MLIAHYNNFKLLRHGGIAAAFLLLLACRAASTLETNAANATAPAAVSAPPITDYRSPITDFPLLPQSVPLSSVQSLLDLARHSACRAAARSIEDGTISAALAALDALTAGAFHWRGAVTNGYQQGFFVNALRGYCFERTGDIVKAYRAYQTSRAYFDDQVAAVQCPEPRLEVFLGLGRTCLVAGRYTDAFNWLDLVRLEASAEPRLAAAADRALIRRAVEIGDYHDAITNFWDLQFLLTESEESPHGGGSHIAQAEKSTSKFVRRERIYTPKEYTELAQLYFWTHQDRPGFKTVLDGITLLGIDNDLGVKDPLVDCFLNNIMRADDVEIQRFYDLLGYAITQARAQKGDEAYLAWLCKARLLFCKVCGFLQASDDLSGVAQRVTARKTELAQSNALSAVRPRTARHLSPHGIVLPPSCAESEALADATNVIVENALMTGDCYAKQDRYGDATRWYAFAWDFIVSARYAQVEYDGCAPRNAAALAANLTRVRQEKHAPLYPFAWDCSYRANLLGLLLYQQATNAAHAALYQEHFDHPYALLTSHPLYAWVAMDSIPRWAAQGRLREIITLCRELVQCNANSVYSIGCQYFPAHFALAEFRRGLDAFRAVLTHRTEPFEALDYAGWCNGIDEIRTLLQCEQRALLSDAVQDDLQIGRLIARQSADALWLRMYEKLHECINDKRWADAYACYKQLPYRNRILSFACLGARLALASGLPDNAFEILREGVDHREKFCNEMVTHASSLAVTITLSPEEIAIIKECSALLNKEQRQWCTAHGVTL